VLSELRSVGVWFGLGSVGVLSGLRSAEVWFRLRCSVLSRELEFRFREYDPDFQRTYNTQTKFRA